MSDQLLALRLFSRIARTGSFSRAAREMKLSQPTASRIIATLERELGASLFLRTTRALSLTEAGSDYLARIQAILDALEEADQAVRGTGDLRGTLRIGISSSFAARAVIPRLPAFAERHPSLRIDLLVDDDRQDLIAEGVDVALRFGRMADSSAVARRIGNWPVMIAAAPSYLARVGTPTSPADLSQHSAVVYGRGSDAAWSFRKNGREISVRVSGQVTTSSSDAAMAGAIAGLGIFSAIEPAFGRELREGELVRLLPDWDMGRVDVHALFPSGQAAKPAARAFADFLVADLRDL